MEENHMEAIKIFNDKSKAVDWEYDEEVDAFYLSFGNPRPATGIDIGEGIIVRYDEKARELVGLTIIGVRSRLGDYLKEKG